MSAGSDRIPSLDGLRAISIVMVLAGHLAGTRYFPISTGTGNFLGSAELGVHVFFVISGYLITTLLLAELARYGRISIGHFYLRRTLRIFPPYYTLILVLIVSQALGLVVLAPEEAAHALTYTSNYYPARSWFTGHTWSLSVEEQFYLLWPAVLVLAGRRRAILLAGLAIAAVPLVRLASWELMRWAADGIDHRFETVADAIAAGCVLAGVRPRLHRSSAYARLLASPFFLAVPALVVAANLLHDHPVVFFTAGLTIVNVGVALCLDWCLTYPDGRIGRALNARPLVFVGALSYSLYLWQQLFLNRESSAAVAAFPVNIALAAVAALVSYYLVEQPALAVRRRIEAALATRRPAALAAQSAALVALLAAALLQAACDKNPCEVRIAREGRLDLAREDDRRQAIEELEQVRQVAAAYGERAGRTPLESDSRSARQAAATRGPRATRYCESLLIDRLAKAHGVDADALRALSGPR